MSGQLAISLSKPITLVSILDSHHTSNESNLKSDSDHSELTSRSDTEEQQAILSQACQTLHCVIEKLQNFYDKIFVEHREEIARLSVEIARKILVYKVEKGDYEIESIVKKVLNKSPTHQDLDVHLNPEDFVQIQKALQEESVFAGVKFTSDPNISQAECLLKSPKGNIESSINNHLEQIYEALKKVK
jgi:flagellar biosynthesis/type III secretory pathway protein FliH